MSVSFEQKRATVRFEFGKVRLDQILKRYAGTPFTVTPAGPVTVRLRQEQLAVQAWSDPPSLPQPTSQAEAERTRTLYLEFIPADGYRVSGSPVVRLKRPLVVGLKLSQDFAELNQPKTDERGATAARRLAARVEASGPFESDELALPVEFNSKILDNENKEQRRDGTISVPLLVSGRDGRSAAAGVALVGGALDLGLGHLCDQHGCVEHLHQSLQAVRAVAGVRARPSLTEPRASVFVRAGEPIDLWALREKLRDQGVEVRHATPRDFGPLVLQVELRRWLTDRSGQDSSQCLGCLERSVGAARAIPWAATASAAEGGIRIRVPPGEPDVGQLFSGLDRVGVAPAAVWLVPDGVPVPQPSPPKTARRDAEPKCGGSESHPLIQFDLSHSCTIGAGVLDLLGQQPWASRTGAAPDRLGAIAPARALPGATALVAVGDRQHADLLPLVRELRAAGQRPTQIRLAGFHDVRLQFEFTHLCGDVEYSKPPKKEDKKPDDKKPADNKAHDKKPDEKKAADAAPAKADPPPAAEKKEEKPFVPQPLRPAPSSNARQAIERAVAGVAWVRDATYHDYHTKPEFNGPRKLFLSLTAAAEDVVRLDELLAALTDAGFPPTAVRASRLFPGLAFGQPLPADLELVAPDGAKRAFASLRQPGRPLAVLFASVNCPKWDKYKYEPDPKLYGQVKRSVESFRDRVDFVAINSNADDEFAKTAEFWKGTELPVPLLRDADGRVRAVLNAQITPPPHVFLFDADGRLRYAGDPHDNWNKPTEPQKDFLGPALELVLAGKFGCNGAVHFNSSNCNCSSPNCKCPKCGCGPSCRCDIGH